MARIARSEFSAHAALKAGANSPVPARRIRRVAPPPIRWGLCFAVALPVVAFVVVAFGGAL